MVWGLRVLGLGRGNRCEVVAGGVARRRHSSKALGAGQGLFLLAIVGFRALVFKVSRLG